MSTKSSISEWWRRVPGRLAALCLLCAPAAQVAHADALPDMPDPAFSAVASFHVPQGMEARSVALILSGAEGWKAELEARASRLSELHTLVIGIDSRALARLAPDCAASAEILADLGDRLRDHAGAMPRLPVLAGIGAGGHFALSAARMLPGRFKGLVTEGYGDEASLCRNPAEVDKMGPKAPLRWLDIVDDGAISRAENLKGTRVVRPTEGLRKAFYRSYLGLAGTDHAFDIRTRDMDPRVRDLPLTIHQVADAPKTDLYAIFLSGDGGWANFDEEISDLLAAAGVPVVGISSLRYLWQEREPKEIAADIARLDAHYRHRFDRRKLLLLGFSLGANVTPFYVPHLPEPLRRRLAGVALIAPEARTGFEIVAGGWLGLETGAEPVGPAIDMLSREVTPAFIACLFGTEEAASPCPGATLPGIRRLPFPGGHHLGKAHAAIADAILTFSAPAGPGDAGHSAGPHDLTEHPRLTAQLPLTPHSE